MVTSEMNINFNNNALHYYTKSPSPFLRNYLQLWSTWALVSQPMTSYYVEAISSLTLLLSKIWHRSYFNNIRQNGGVLWTYICNILRLYKQKKKK